MYGNYITSFVSSGNTQAYIHIHTQPYIRRCQYSYAHLVLQTFTAPTNTSATSSQSGTSSEYAVIQKPTNKKVPHLTVNSGDKYALSTHVNSLELVKHDNNHKQQYEADGTDRKNEKNTNAG